MTIRRKSLSLLLTAVMLVTTGLPLWTNPAPSVCADSPPPAPLPFECGGVTPPGGTPPACCIYGYVYYGDMPVDGVNVHIESPYGTLNTSTASDGQVSSYPHYAVDLSSAPLLVSPGDVITITASYNGMASARTWAVQANGQQVDLGLVAGYQVPDAPIVRKSRRGGGGMFAPPAETLRSAALQASFTDIGAGLADVYRSGVWGDYDNDGDLDILVPGSTGSAPIAKVYRNNTAVANTSPAVPIGLSASVTDTAVMLSWNAVADSQTPVAGLTCNLRVGTTPSGANVFGPTAHSSGYRKVVTLGNANHGITVTPKNLVPGTYYWSVQAVDTAFAGSAFASEESFSIPGGMPSVQFSSSAYSVNENACSATITVTLSAASAQTITVNYITSDGTAIVGSDYISASGTLEFDPGETSQTLVVPIVNDESNEANETVTVTLSSPVYAVLGTPVAATLTIVDEDYHWIELAPAGSPPHPVWVSKPIHYDAVNNRLIAFFPGNPPYNPDPPGNGNEVWILTNANGLGGTPTWIELEPSGTPPSSNGDESVVYDAATNRLIVYGGCTANCSPARSEVFVLTHANGLGGTPAWSQISVTNPDNCVEHSAIYDSANDLMIVFGGHMAFYGTNRNDTRVLTNANGTTSPSTWTTLSPTGGPPGIRSGHTAIYEPTSNRMTVFGGSERISALPYTHYEYNDVWLLSDANGYGNPTWTQLAPSGDLPFPRDVHSAVYDSANNRMIVYGGSNFSETTQSATCFGDLWELSNANGLGGASTWRELSSSGASPGPRRFHTAAMDVANQRMIVFGGQDQITTTNRIWVLVLPQPTITSTVQASFTASPISGEPPLPVVFTDTSTGDVNAWEWDFGDGGTSAEQHPTHIYTSTGTYTVSLLVSGPGGSDSETKVAYITVGYPAPTAGFTAAPLSGTVPLSVTFTDESVGNVTAWSWDFGDGGASSDQYPTHVYTSTNTYTVSLLVSGLGGSDSETKVAYITVSYPAPTAAFIASPVTGTVPLNAAFTDQSTGAIIAWDWTFGDTGVSGARYPEHEYTIPGTYTVSLTVTGPGGSDNETKANYITVSPGEISWAFLLYLAGDNNLHSPLQTVLDKLEEAVSANPNIAILVLIDGRYHGDAWRYHVQPDGNYTEDNCWYMNELNMGAPHTLSDFVIWAREEYTATHYYLAVADHGRGTEGIAWDNTPFEGELLTVAELGTALRDATAYGTKPLDVVHYDACLMAMIEDAYQIKDYARYLVASENLGWSIFAYDRYAAWAVADTTPEQLASAIVDEYHYVLTGYELPHTISAMDLEQAGAVEDAVTALATALLTDLNANKYYVSGVRSATQKFDSQDYFMIRDNDEYLDLYDFARLIKQSVPDSSVKNAAQGVMDAVSACVVAERHESGYYLDYPYWDLDDAHGMAIYFPQLPGGYGYDDYVNNASFRFTVDGQWGEFLQAYYAVMGLPPGQPVDPGIPPMPVPAFRVYLPLVAKVN